MRLMDLIVHWWVPKHTRRRHLREAHQMLSSAKKVNARAEEIARLHTESNIVNGYALDVREVLRARRR